MIQANSSKPAGLPLNTLISSHFNDTSDPRDPQGPRCSLLFNRLYCSMFGSNEEDVLLLEEPTENVHVNIRHTKVFLINAVDPLSGLTLVWECEALAHCIVEHHKGFLYRFTDVAKGGQPVDYHYLLCSPVDISAPRKWEGAIHLKELNPHFPPLPKYVSQISPRPNYDYYSATMRFTISSPVLSALLQ